VCATPSPTSRTGLGRACGGLGESAAGEDAGAGAETTFSECRGGATASGEPAAGRRGGPGAVAAPRGLVTATARLADGTVGRRAGERERTRAPVRAEPGIDGPVTTWPAAPSPLRPPLSSVTATATASVPGPTSVPPRRHLPRPPHPLARPT